MYAAAPAGVCFVVADKQRGSLNCLTERFVYLCGTLAVESFETSQTYLEVGYLKKLLKKVEVGCSSHVVIRPDRVRRWVAVDDE